MEFTAKQVRDAVDQVFTNVGRSTRVNIAYVSAATVQLLLQPVAADLDMNQVGKMYRSLSKRVESYIKRSNQRGGKIQVRAGKHGGVFLRHEVSG